ncbi:MAG: hypothetical protein ACFN0X_06040 [Mitsuokella sp.]
MKREFILGGAMLLAVPVTFAAFGVLMQPDGQEEARPSATAKALARQDGSPARIAVKSGGEAVAASALGNPFSLRHENRTMQEKPSQETGERTDASPMPPPAPTPIQADGGKPSAAARGEAPPAAVLLKGIAYTGSRGMAILSNGRDTETRAVGEVFAGYEVESIDPAGVTLRGQAGSLRLSLPPV